MKKAERIESRVVELAGGRVGGLDPCYAAYFACFNAREYYEAHDVLEHLWLRCRDENHGFYKGLIQIAGGFVHLRKHYIRPHHHKDGRRLAPAARLLRLGLDNIGRYRSPHLHLDLEAVADLCRWNLERIEASGCRLNPWRPETAPTIELIA